MKPVFSSLGLAWAFAFALALALLQGCLAEPQLNEALLSALNVKPQTPVFQTSILSSGASHILPTSSHLNSDDVLVSNKEYKVADRYVGTLGHPVSTGEVLKKQVETIAIGQKKDRLKTYLRPQIYTQQIQSIPLAQPIQTQYIQQAVPVQTVQTQLVQQTVPVQTVQYVQQPQYQPIQVQREVVQVEKPVPVPVPKPVAVVEPPKPYVKEAVYARPFQVAQPYVKTRITPILEATTQTPIKPPAPIPPVTPDSGPVFDQVTEEHLYYANKRRKIVTRFIKVVEYYEADTTEDVGVYYRLADLTDDNFELQVTEIYDAGKPVLVSNSTSTKQILVTPGQVLPPKHLIYEYENNVLVHSYPAEQVFGYYGDLKPTTSHFERFHKHSSPTGTLSSIDNINHYEGFNIKTYTETGADGKLRKISERRFEMPGGKVILIERRVRFADDESPFPAQFVPITTSEVVFDKTKNIKVLQVVMTYDATIKQRYDSKYGVSTTTDFVTQFKQILNDFETSFKDIPRIPLKPKRSKRSTPIGFRYKGKDFDKVETLAKTEFTPGGDIYQSADGEKLKLEQERLAAIQGPPRNEYLRYGKIYVPKKKVKYDVIGLHGEPIDQYFDYDKLGSQLSLDKGFDFDSLGGQLSIDKRFNFDRLDSSLLSPSYSTDNLSYKYGTPYSRHPFYSVSE